MVYEMKVDDVMTTTVVTVNAEDHMSIIREVLRRNRISGLPVLDRDRLVGLIRQYGPVGVGLDPRTKESYSVVGNPSPGGVP